MIMMDTLERARWYHVVTVDGKQWISNGYFMAHEDCQYVQEILAAINEDIVGVDGAEPVADGAYCLNNFVRPVEPSLPDILKSALASRLTPASGITPVFRDRAIVLRLTHGVTHQALVAAIVTQDFVNPNLTFCISDMITPNPHPRDASEEEVHVVALVNTEGTPVVFFAGCGTQVSPVS
jgi:hypothetical protein